jgi:hypothetical protein
MRIFLVWLCMSTALFRACGCNCKQVTAKCTDKADITSVDFGPSRVGTTSIGILNTHHFQVGDVIELIPPQAGQQLGTGSRVDTLTYNDAQDFLPDDPPATASQVVATDFELNVDAELKAFTAQIKTALQNDTKLTLTEGSRHALAHPLEILGSASNRSVSQRILEHPDRQYIVVTGIVNGKDVKLEYQSDKSGSVKVNVLKIPGTKFSAEVTYSCSNVTNLNSVAGQPKAGLAFFYTTVGAVNAKVDTIATADLTKYSLVNAVL